jgi:hypothetical protein
MSACGGCTETLTVPLTAKATRSTFFVARLTFFDHRRAALDSSRRISFATSKPRHARGFFHSRQLLANTASGSLHGALKANLIVRQAKRILFQIDGEEAGLMDPRPAPDRNRYGGRHSRNWVRNDAADAREAISERSVRGRRCAARPTLIRGGAIHARQPPGSAFLT